MTTFNPQKVKGGGKKAATKKRVHKKQVVLKFRGSKKSGTKPGTRDQPTTLGTGSIAVRMAQHGPEGEGGDEAGAAGVPEEGEGLVLGDVEPQAEIPAPPRRPHSDFSVPTTQEMEEEED